MQSPQTVTVVYGADGGRPCSDEMLRARQGNQDWRTEVFIARTGGVGGASVIEEPLPVELKTRYPGEVVVYRVEYRCVGVDEREVESFENRNGDVIRGRLPLSGSVLGMHNLTRSAGAGGSS